MSKSFSLRQLTEGIRDRNLAADHSRLVSKWTRTGLLRGLNEHKRENMSRLLENQAAQVLREANTLGSQGSGSVEGFSNIAFPIVRRVFGGLVANELVSIQPMSLPSGLLFYLDYTYGSDVGGDTAGDGNDSLAATGAVYEKGESLYGNPAGKAIRTGADATGGMYDLIGSSYSKVYEARTQEADGGSTADAWSAYDANSGGAYNSSGVWTTDASLDATTAKNLKLIQYDPQLLKEIAEFGTAYVAVFININTLTDFDPTLAKGIGIFDAGGASANANGTKIFGGATGKDSSGVLFQSGKNLRNLKRLNQIGTWDGANFVPDVTGNQLLVILESDSYVHATWADVTDQLLLHPKSDGLSQPGTSAEGTTLVVPSFESNFDSPATPVIPEIDIKIESIAVTAQTRKLRARWSPELAQDLNAYHSMDAEVELTQILSEQIALEIDREILNDLLVEAKAANYYWSRAPGKFVKKDTGAVASSTIGPVFTGTVREWYETLVETIIDVANEIHRKTLRGSANFIVVSPEVATIFEASVLYKPSIKLDGQGQASAPFSIGAEAIGSLSNRFTVYKDPYFPRNKILVGYKGGSYLESGYVYAPYVPLIVTPTIFAPEDFTPRKGVMTRYGKKMVRADFYGTVTCLDMDII